MVAHDLIGIGFGPSNLALAIALEEHAGSGRPIDAQFIECQPTFGWHADMMLSHAHMQVSFLKDLATLRNPSSRYTFVNYLHQKGRLQDFINLKTFYPSRREFNDYLAWAAAAFSERCAYGEEVVDVLPEANGNEVDSLRVRSRDRCGEIHDRLARNLVVAIGGQPSVPDVFQDLSQDPRLVHSSTYLRSGLIRPGAQRIALIGAGQSAAELFIDLHGRPHAPQVDLIMRARSIRQADDSPFVNEIFNSAFVDHVYAQPRIEREALLREFRHTNYACPDLALVERMFEIFYEQRVAGNERHRCLRRHVVQSARGAADGIHLNLLDLDRQHEAVVRYDAVLLATGYVRRHHRRLLARLAPYLGDFEVDRDYRVRAARGFRPAVFLQGACEDSHGLSDTLLSVTSVRSDVVRKALEAS